MKRRYNEGENYSLWRCKENAQRQGKCNNASKKQPLAKLNQAQLWVCGHTWESKSRIFQKKYLWATVKDDSIL